MSKSCSPLVHRVRGAFDLPPRSQLFTDPGVAFSLLFQSLLGPIQRLRPFNSSSKPCYYTQISRRKPSRKLIALLETLDCPPLKSEPGTCTSSKTFSECTLYSLGDLPLVEAIYKEVLRWRPAAPFTIPRLVTADDVFQGTSSACPAFVFVHTIILRLCDSQRHYGYPK